MSEPEPHLSQSILASRHSRLGAVKQRLGCWLRERWKTEFVLQFSGLAKRLGMTWMDLCNRNEHLTIDPETGARICHWEDSSQLTVGRLFPDVGRRLLSHCLNEWPIAFNFETATTTCNRPDISVLIAIGGADRLQLLTMVLAALRAQTHAAFEIIVVEQGPQASLKGLLPNDVTYRYTPRPERASFNKSMALNQGARLAKGRVLLIHDADLVVPVDYLVESSRVLGDADAARVGRFLFYLNQDTTSETLRRRQLISSKSVESVVQNTPNPMAVTAEAYQRVGGHDESYVGWGGEDTEFLSRLRTGRVKEGGSLPVVHLWHPPAPKRASGDRNQQLHREKESLTPQQRIRKLLAAQG